MSHRLGEAKEANLRPEDVEKVLREMRTFCCAELRILSVLKRRALIDVLIPQICLLSLNGCENAL